MNVLILTLSLDTLEGMLRKNEYILWISQIPRMCWECAVPRMIEVASDSIQWGQNFHGICTYGTHYSRDSCRCFFLLWSDGVGTEAAAEAAAGAVARKGAVI